MKKENSANNKDHYSDLEEYIVDIAESLKNTDGFISLSSLIQVCNQKLRISHKELFSIIIKMVNSNKIKNVSTIISKNIKHLIEKNLIEDGTEQITSLLMRNINRKQIYLLLKTYNGLNFSELKKYTKLGNNQLNLYLNQLINFQIISYFNLGHSKVFFLSSNPRNSVIIQYIKNKNYYREILFELKNQKRRLAELVNVLSIHHSTVQYYLKQLNSLGIIVQLQEGNIVYYCLKSEFFELI